MKFLVMLIVLGAVESVPVVRRLDGAQEAAAAECGDCEVTAAEAELLRRDRTVYSSAGDGEGEGWGEVVIDREFIRGADNRLVVLVRMVIETGTGDMEEESSMEEEEASTIQLLS